MKKDVRHLQVQLYNLTSLAVLIHYTELYVLDDVISILHIQT